MSIDFYGIPNCDTVKKARAWLDGTGIDYAFHDYKKEGADPVKLAQWVAAKGWEAVLNRRGTTFRQLDEADKGGIDAAKAVELMQAHPVDHQATGGRTSGRPAGRLRRQRMGGGARSSRLIFDT